VSLRGIILLLWFLPSIPICFVRPFYGVVVWTIVAFTSLQWYTWGAANLIPWALVVAVPTILGFAVFGRGIGHIASRESTLLLLLWIWFGVTTVVSINTPAFHENYEDALYHITLVSKILLMTFVTIGIVDSFARLRSLVIVIASCFGFFVLKALPFMILSGGENRIYGPERSMIGDNNDFGLALNMTLPFFFFLAQSETKPWLKRLFGGLFLITIPAIFFTYSRGALLGLVAVLGLMILQTKHRLLLIPLVLVGMVLAVLFAPERWKERMDPTKENVIDNSAASRINSWTYSWNLATDYPIAGGGFGAFTPSLFQKYAPNPKDVHGPHSVYFGILAEHGFVGLFLYLTLIVSCFLSTAKIVKWAHMHGDEVAANYANMFRFSLVGFLTSGLFLGRAYFDYYYTIIACIVVLKNVVFATAQEASLDENDAEEEEGDEDWASLAETGI
jgi:putative inorganic carbon (HCO3(-)) transporter